MIIYKDYIIKELTSFKLNCKAKYVFEANNAYEIFILKYLFDYFEINYNVLGKGSKVIFDKSYITTPIILISSNFEELYYLDNSILVSSGYDIKKLILRLANKNIGGFHYLYPLPASIGGMTYMNASDNKVEISSFIKSVIVLDEKNNIKILSNEECEFSYRNSIFNNKKYIILYILLNYNNIDKMTIYNEIKNAQIYRIKHQEISNTFGSIFKNGNDYKVYQLINGIKELLPKIDELTISEKHSNFLVNINCKPEIVIEYIKHIKTLVLAKYNVILKEEVNILS